jgi:hypothetical protein
MHVSPFQNADNRRAQQRLARPRPTNFAPKNGAPPATRAKIKFRHASAACRRSAVAGGLATFAALLALLPTPASAVTVALSNSVVGQTPEIVGYNVAHYMPGSNTASWWRYSGVNGARVWATPAVVEGADDNGLWGDGVATQQQFIDRRAALRANPLSTTYVNWPYFESRYQNNPTTGNNVNLHQAFASLQALGVEPVVQIHRSTGAYPFPTAGTSGGWAARWEHWQHFYAQAFYLAKNFDVARFQMYNEPNHSSNAALSQAEYLERLQLASDAVQSAIADVNALYGKSLDAQMQGPVTAGANSLYNARTTDSDPRDDVTGWGELVINNLHTNYLGQTDPSFKLIDTYAYQQYSGNASTWTNNHTALRNLVNADAPGENIRFAVTEMNVSTAANFELTTDTLDTPSRFAQMGSILATMAKQQADELYVFKFSQTADNSDSGVKKNGVHYVDNDSAPYNIGGSTKAAEVVRLFAKGFAGAQELLQTPTATGSGSSNLQLAAARDSVTGNYSLLSSNLATSSRTLDLNLGAWGLPAGTYVTVEEVSTERHGEIRQLVQVPASGLISLNQPAESVFLIGAPQSPPAYRVTLGATDDAMVKAGGNGDSNYGASANLYAKNDATNAAARNVTFMKFDMGAIGAESVEQAILRVHGENVGTDATVITHIYGLLGDDWDEASITWNNAPNLKDSLGTVNDISHNVVEGIGTTAEIVGHFTGVQTARELMFDVTPFVQSHPDQQITFLIAREVRFDGENVDDALTSLRLDSKESGADPGPQLILSLNSSPLPADFNGDGAVDGDDLAAWTAGVGEGASKLTGDADGDGDADGSDFLAWQQAIGTQVTTYLATAATAVPEPFAARIGVQAAYVVVLLHRVIVGAIR